VNLYFTKKKILGITLAWLFVVFILVSFVLLQMEFFNTDVVDKSPVLPYKRYDYMTVEETEYLINDQSDYIPAYFRTDFASIPQFLWFLDAPYRSEYVYASLWHDYRYSCPSGLTRKQVDDIFYSLLISEKASTWSAIKLYIAVRIFGEKHFYKGSCDEIIHKQIEEDEDFYTKEVIDEE